MRSIRRMAWAGLLTAAMIVTATLPTFAATPKKEHMKYKGKGVVEVEFRGDVEYSQMKITVKDNKGGRYKVSIRERDEDEIKFAIRKFKTGRAYRFAIEGVRKEYTRKYGTVKGKVKIPAKKAATTQACTAKSAKNKAIADAISRTQITRSAIRDLEVERDTYRGKKVWEVSFEARKGSLQYEYEYQIECSTGKILHREIELD